MAGENKTEKATPRRRGKAREKGQGARSRALVAVVGTMSGVLLLAWQLPVFAHDWRGLLRHQLENAAANPEQLMPAWRNDQAIFRGVVLAAALSWMLAVLSG